MAILRVRTFPLLFSTCLGPYQIENTLLALRQGSINAAGTYGLGTCEMFVWTQHLSGQLIFANSACQAQMPTFSTSSQVMAELSHTQGSATAPQTQTVCPHQIQAREAQAASPSPQQPACSTGKSVVFYTLQQKCVAKVNESFNNAGKAKAKAVCMISLTDRHSCIREAASSAGGEETWWGYGRLSMVAMELKTNLQLRRATQVCVRSARNSGQQTQLSSPFLQHILHISVCKVATTRSFSRGDKSLHSEESLAFKWADHPGHVSRLCLRKCPRDH